MDEFVTAAPHAAASLFATAIAIWLLYLNPRSRVAWGAAAFLALRGAIWILNGISHIQQNSQEVWRGLANYLLLGIFPISAVFLALVLDVPRRSRAAIVLTSLALWAVLAGAYAADECLVRCVHGKAEYGPLVLFSTGAGIAFSIVGFIMLRQAESRPLLRQRHAAFWISVAFFIQALAASANAAFLAATKWDLVFSVVSPSAWSYLSYILNAATLFPAMAGVGLLAMHARDHFTPRAQAAVFSLALASLLIGSYNGYYTETSGGQFGLMLLGIEYVLFPPLLAYAIVQYRLLGPTPRLSEKEITRAVTFVALAPFLLIATYLLARAGHFWAVFIGFAGIVFALPTLLSFLYRFTSARYGAILLALIGGFLTLTQASVTGLTAALLSSVSLVLFGGGIIQSPPIRGEKERVAKRLHRGSSITDEEIQLLDEHQRQAHYRQQVYLSVRKDGSIHTLALDELEELQARLGIADERAKALAQEARRQRLAELNQN